MLLSLAASTLLLAVLSSSAAPAANELAARNVTSAALQNSLSLDSLLAHAKKLTEFATLSNGTRALGTAGHNATVTYIKQLLDDTGAYTTQLQSFPTLIADSMLWNLTVDGQKFESKGFMPSNFFELGDASADPITGRVVTIPNSGCEWGDFEGDLWDKIVLLKGGGECSDRVKWSNAGSVGGLLISTPETIEDHDTQILDISKRGHDSHSLRTNPRSLASGRGDPREPPSTRAVAPALYISNQDHARLAESLSARKEVVATVYCVVTRKEKWSSNLIATTKTGDQANIVMAGAHSDSVPAGPGINDNGSGTITLLDLALQLSKFQFNNAVRFGWWSAEERGMLGSDYYVKHLSPAEQQSIALYLNFDMTASPNAGYFIFDGDGDTFGNAVAPGSAHIEHTFLEYFAAERMRNGTIEFSRDTDYVPFMDAYIPVGGLFSGAGENKTEEEAAWCVNSFVQIVNSALLRCASRLRWGGKANAPYDPCYHQACDTIENLNTKALLFNAKGAAHAIATYANSLEAIPRSRDLDVSDDSDDDIQDDN
ncbi:hypothetical protein HGRIS_010424 [Hohenbuehelia grisea]|uniref:Peptide hydrolase n=1 Tax=Hohenbuehelia grisea TaxID=104357 RepID=A0ABR3IZI6_9AGAR